MTYFISCDGCGQVSSDTNDDDDPLARWWGLYEGGVSHSSSILQPISITQFMDEDLLDGDVVEPEPEPGPPEPPRHFCGFGCLAAWVTRRQAAAQ